MFIEQGINAENKFWKYLLGSVVILFASTLGQIPFLLAVFLKSFLNDEKNPIKSLDPMRAFDSNLTLFLLLLSFAFAIFGVFLVVKYFHNQPFLKIVTSRKQLDWRRILFSFTIWTIFTILSTYVLYYFNQGNFIYNFKLVPFIILFFVGIVMFPIQTSCEEFVFRGYLMQGFGNLSLNKWFPLVMTSVIFGSLHLFNPEVDKMGYIILVYYIGTGFLLGILTLMDEGMELSLGFHAANNLIGALLISSEWSVFQTNSMLKDISEPSAGIDIILPVLVVYPILLSIFSWKYKWKNWKEKLTGKIVLRNIKNNNYE